MSTYNNKLTGYQKNTKEITCFVEDSSGAVENLSGYDGYFYARKYPPAYDSPLDISVGHTSIDASNGAVYFNLDSSTMNLNDGDYIYEIIIDNGVTKVSVVQDRLQILDSIN